MKTIIHITTYLQGGAGKIICELISHQVAQGERVICITEEYTYENYFNYPEYEERLLSLGVQLIKCPGLFKRDNQSFNSALKAMSNLLQKEAVNIIHSHAAQPANVAYSACDALSIKIPILNTMHGWGTNKTPVQENQDINTLSRLDAIVAVSKSSERLLHNKGILPKLTSVIYNGISEKSSHQSSSSHHLNYSIEPKSGDTFTIGCIGTICERKNQELIVDAIALINDTHSSSYIHCILIGEDDSSYAEQLKRKVEDLNLSPLITFTGYQEHADSYLSHLDLLVLPTRAEGLPITILEAFRDRVLVAASDIVECQELILDNNNGLLFSPNSIEQLVEVILSVANHNRIDSQAMKKNAYDFYQQHLQIKAMFTNYDNLYSSLLSQSKGII